MYLYVINCIVSLVLQVITQFKEQGINTEIYYKNKEMGDTFSIVPTSAIRYEIFYSSTLRLMRSTVQTNGLVLNV